MELPAEPQGKPKNTGVGSLSLLQGIFATQELNQGLLHCREILYQLSYQGSLELANVPVIPVLRQRIVNRGSNKKGLPKKKKKKDFLGGAVVENPTQKT